MHPDGFLVQLLDREPSAVLDTLEAQAGAWAGGRSITELIDALERTSATRFAAAVRVFMRISRRPADPRSLVVHRRLWQNVGRIVGYGACILRSASCARWGSRWLLVLW
jgi:hypothetical protein